MVNTISKEKLNEKCGVFGICAPGKSAAKIIFYGLQALQHRGQESAGIAVSDGENILVFKDLGLVSRVFNEQNIAPLQGHIGIGHTRYSATGMNIWKNSQPLYHMFKNESFAIANNGNLTNTNEIRNELIRKGVKFDTTTDTEVIASLIGSSEKDNIEDAIKEMVSKIKGCYSILILTRDKIFGIRDPHGFRPLVLGNLDGDYVIASETCALDIVDAKFVREIDPGEIIILDKDGARSQMVLSVDRISMCIFELIYFARPDSYIYGKNMFAIRHRLGQELAKECPADADIVISVPDSGTPAAIGYSKESKIPYAEGFIKNRYVGRTFIQPEQKTREISVKLKLNPLRDIICGKRLVVVDDSIIRGTTSKKIVKMLYDVGAREVHLRITCPPLLYPCYYGVDMARRNEFIANHKTLENIREFLKVDSLGYLSMDGLIKAVGESKEKFCFACFNGEYPVPVSDNPEFNKHLINKEKRVSSNA